MSNNGPFITISPTFEFESDQSILIKLIWIQNFTNKHNSGLGTMKYIMSIHQFFNNSKLCRAESLHSRDKITINLHLHNITLHYISTFVIRSATIYRNRYSKDVHRTKCKYRQSSNSYRLIHTGEQTPPKNKWSFNLRSPVSINDLPYYVNH